jgi:N-methylhydantoinase B/oxoprolinase/acetone carboxylase alpha subunit
MHLFVVINVHLVILPLILEQMGRILQRTSISTNIKERLDFSCALFDHTGGLVSNAPHIPGIFKLIFSLQDTPVNLFTKRSL